MKLRHLRLMKRSTRQRAVAQAAADAFGAWRQECAAVHIAYGHWAAVSAVDKPLAFAAYNAALDREEHAAGHYARLMSRVEPFHHAALERHVMPIEAAEWIW
jgi:hypothetical protein